MRLQNQLEYLLEEAHLKLTSLVWDLLGARARRLLQALAEGETNPMAVATWAEERWRATPEPWWDALGAGTDRKPVYRRLLKMALEQLHFLEQQIGQPDQEMASLLRQHQDAVEQLAEMPGLGVDSAQQILAEVGPTAATFPSEKCLSSWVGACPGEEESAGVNYSHRSPKGHRHLGAFSTRRPMPQSRLKELCSRWFIVVRYRVWDTNQRSGRWPIDTVGGLGGSCTRESVTKNEAPPSPNDPNQGALPE